MLYIMVYENRIVSFCRNVVVKIPTYSLLAAFCNSYTVLHLVKENLFNVKRKGDTLRTSLLSYKSTLFVRSGILSTLRFLALFNVQAYFIYCGLL